MAIIISQASPAQGKALALVPRFSSFLSLLGSLYIVYDVLRMPRAKHKVYHRLMLGMSLFDCIASTAWFVGTWAIPSDVLPVYGAHGNQATCTLEGFLIQLSISTAIYNGCLACYYFLVIRLSWSDRQLKKSRVEYLFHAVAITFGFGTATAAAAMNLFNPFGWNCWLSAVPFGCRESWLHGGESTCGRGDNATLYQWLFYFIPLWAIIFLVTILMSLIVYYFVQQERSNAQWDFSINNSNSSPHLTLSTVSLSTSLAKSTSIRRPRASMRSSQRARETTWQAICYVGSFLLTWTFPTILIIHELMVDQIYYHWVLLMALFMPAQGFFNFLVYLRPRHLKAKAERRRQRKRELALPQQEQEAAARCPSPRKAASFRLSVDRTGNITSPPPQLLADEAAETTESTVLETDLKVDP